MLNEKELNALMAAVTPFDDLKYFGALYGDFGKRKTTTALRCMRRKAVLLHADRGWNVIRNHPDEFNEDNVIPIEYEGLSQVKAIIEAITEQQGKFEDTDLFVWDTVSQSQERYIDFLGENFTIKGRDVVSPAPGAKDEMGNRLREETLVGLSDYHLTRNKMRPIMDLLVRAPFDVILLAHVRYPSQLEIQKGILARRPNLTEKVWDIIARDATFVGYMEEKKGDYIVDFKPTSTLQAKSQIPALTNQQIKTNELPQYLWDWKEGK